MRKLKYQEVYDFVKDRGCELLSKEYIGFDKKLKILFACGHAGERSFNKFKTSSNVCPACSPNKQYSEEEIISKFREQGFILEKGKYLGNANTKLDLMDLEGYKYRFSYHAFDNTYNNRKQKKHFVAKDNIYSLENMFLWVEKNNKKYKITCEEYLGGHVSNIFVECKICHYSWRTAWSNLFTGHECQVCQTKRIAENNIKRNVTDEKNLKIDAPFLMEEWDYEKNSKKPEEYSLQSNKKVHWICYFCGEKWIAPICSRTSGRGCLACKQSGGEKRVYYFLKENKIDFEPQFSFDDLFSDYGKPLRFDFAVFQNNGILKIIEYDGKQHHKYTPFMHGCIENFYASQKRDKMKDDYCKEHGIPLLRIPDTEFKNIESILTKELNLKSSMEGGLLIDSKN